MRCSEDTSGSIDLYLKLSDSLIRVVSIGQSCKHWILAAKTKYPQRLSEQKVTWLVRS